MRTEWSNAVTKLSIIIPAVGSQSILDETLVSVLENRPAECEVLVATPPEYSDPYDLGDEVRFVAGEAIDPIPLLNAGVKLARGEVMHLLLPGVTVGPGWCDGALELFAEDRNVGSVSPCVVSKGTRKTVQGVAYSARCGKRIVRRVKGKIIAPLLGAGFYQASAMRFMRGFDHRFGECADVELGLRMRSANYKAIRCDSRIRWQQKLRFQPTQGFAGGKVRGRLAQVAIGLGLSSPRSAWMGFFGEMLTNRFLPSTLTAMFGRLRSRSLASPRSDEPGVLPVDGSPSKRRSSKRVA